MVILPPCTHSFRSMAKIAASDPGIKLSYWHSRQWGKKKKKKWRASSFPLRTPPRSFTCYFHLYPVGQNLVAWLHLATREARTCNICVWQSCVHLKVDGSISKRRGNIKYSLPPQHYCTRLCYVRKFPIKYTFM